mmetsp:Transcript_124972/g.186646  ORF Transcript_124972/g.186646 Transcript_124972/m.186646 type:complete len:431 (+) Transcript_124972:157-1449(+)
MNVPEEAKSELLPEDLVASRPEEVTVDAAAEDKPTKKRTWKKPKDKPKRPLSAYNIFFQHQRSRIVDGFTEPAPPEEIVRSIEGILSKSREKRRHRKTHGRISFGDLARAIAESWKSIDPKSKSIFDHYAEVDMMRYRREVKAWKDKKEMEEEAHAMAKHANFMNQMNASFSSVDSADSTYESLPDESTRSEPWNRSKGGIMNEAFNNSFSSVDSGASEFSYEPESIQTIINRQQQILQQQLRESKPSFMGATIPNQRPSVVPNNEMMNSSFSSLQGGNNQNMHSFGHASFGDIQTARMAAYNNWNSAAGHASLNSLPPNEALFTPANLGQSNHVSDYSQSNTSLSYNVSNHTSGFNSSFSSGFHPSAGLAPPSASHFQGHSSFGDMRYSHHQQQQQQQANGTGRQGGNGNVLDSYMNGGMEIDQRSFHR